MVQMVLQEFQELMVPKVQQVNQVLTEQMVLQVLQELMVLKVQMVLQVQQVH